MHTVTDYQTAISNKFNSYEWGGSASEAGFARFAWDTSTDVDSDADFENALAAYLLSVGESPADYGVSLPVYKFSITSFELFDETGDLAIWDQVTETYSWLLKGELSEGRLFSNEPGNDNEMTEQTRAAAEAWFFEAIAEIGTIEFDNLAAMFGV